MLGLVQMLFFVRVAVSASSRFVRSKERGEQLHAEPRALLAAHLGLHPCPDWEPWAFVHMGQKSGRGRHIPMCFSLFLAAGYV